MSPRSPRATPEIHSALTEWAGVAGGLDATLVEQVAAAERAIALIDTELGFCGMALYRSPTRTIRRMAKVPSTSSASPVSPSGRTSVPAKLPSTS